MRSIAIRALLFLSPIVLLSGLLAADPLQSASTGDSIAGLEKQLSEIATTSGGQVGVSAVHLESGVRVGLNASQRFPMASTYKVAIAFQLPSLVDTGKESLDRAITIEPRDIHPEGGPLTQKFNEGTHSFTVRELLEMMLTASDNSATDVLSRLAGGPEAVTSRMRALGISDIRVDRSTIELIFDMLGLPAPPESERGPGRYRPMAAKVTNEQEAAAEERYAKDPRDTAAPDALVSLLSHIYRHEGLSAPSASLLLDIMRRCETGKARLRGALPEGVEVADKTGTGGAGVTNDVAIMTLPGQAGHVAIAVLINQSSQKINVRENAIAQIGRLLWDYFTTHPMMAASE